MRLLLLLLLCAALGTRADSLLSGGHLKGRLNYADFDDGSLFAELSDDTAFDQGADLRLKLRHDSGRWSAEGDYQFIGQFGDSLELAQALPGLIQRTDNVQNDDRRALDLTHEISNNEDRAVIQRLDRLNLGYSSDQWVARLGRQAVSWGNGLIYTPMDVFNPFDPAAVDTEYKSGDDMLYGQYLLDNGDDWQAVWIVRRDEDKNLDSEVNSLAFKYHGFRGELEYDLLLAEHYDDTIVGLGGSLPWGGAVLRADLTLTDTPDDEVVSGVASWSYSWVGWGHNMSGALEYYYNGFGQENEDYLPQQVQDNQDLFVRLARGELFTLARHYLAGSLLVEVTPLFQLTPNVFYNIEDQSLLAQIVASYDLAQEAQLLLALNLPVGSSGTEYGGFDSGIDGLEIDYGSSVFAQLAWYF